MGKTAGGPRAGRTGRDRSLPENPVQPSFEVLLLPDGTVTFSWNSPDIQGMAESLGSPEFETPRWCG